MRPVREQLEHDRVIRLLQTKYKRKFEVAINPGNEQTAPVGPGPAPWYPDLVLLSSERSRKLVGVVEVETSESINHLEAMSQWATFAKLRVPFHLYVPVSGVDSARRLCTDLQIPTTEIWAYHAIGDQIRFTPVQRSAQGSDGRARAETMPARPRETVPQPKAATPVKSAPASRTPARTARAATKSVGRAAAPTKARPHVARSKSASTGRHVDAKASGRKRATTAPKAQKRK